MIPNEIMMLSIIITILSFNINYHNNVIFERKKTVKINSELQNCGVLNTFIVSEDSYYNLEKENGLFNERMR